MPSKSPSADQKNNVVGKTIYGQSVLVGSADGNIGGEIYKIIKAYHILILSHIVKEYFLTLIINLN